jgi:type IV pilus assembly protein PilW
MVELLVGLVVGLIASGAIIQTFSTYEAQKRSTVAGSEAQENGLVALAELEQDIHNAGTGLADAGAFDCVSAQTYTYSSAVNGPIPNFSLAPLIIIAGATSTASDAIQINTGDLLGGIPAFTTKPMASPTSDLDVTRVDGFAAGDLVIVMQSNNCTVMQVSAVSAATVQLAHDTSVGIYNTGSAKSGGWPTYATGARVLDPKTITSKTYQVSNGNLQLVASSTGLTPTVDTYSLVHNVVFMKAQYGVAPIGSQSVDTWVDAQGIWAPNALAASPTNRKRIKAVRFVVVSRSDKQEASNVTTTCVNVSAQVSNGPCAWRDSASNPAPLIDLSADPNWQRYRYKVYQTIVPMRNVLWGNL